MIEGTVTSTPEVVVPLAVIDAERVSHEYESVVDTGFTAELAIPIDVAASLGLTPQDQSWIRLGDGSLASVPLFTVDVEWDGDLRQVAAFGVEGGFLIGMRLLKGFELTAQVTTGGAVSITRMTPE